MLLNLCGLWAAQYEELESGLVQDLCHKILSAVKKLGHNLVLFLQVMIEHHTPDNVQMLVQLLLVSNMAQGRSPVIVTCKSAINVFNLTWISF